MKKLITLLTLLLTVCSGAWADEVTVTWPMIDNDNAASQVGSASVNDIFTVNDAALCSSTEYNALAWAASRELKYSTDGANVDTQFYAGGVSVTNNPNTDNSNASVNENCYLKFSFTLANGVTFTPTGFSFECGKAGTDAGCVQGALILTDGSKAKSSIVMPARTDKKKAYDSHVSKTVTNAEAYAEGSTVTFYIYLGGKLGGKSIYFSDIKIVGTYTSVASSDPIITANNVASVNATESGVAANTIINVTGSHLTGSKLTATLNPAVEGLSVALGSDVISEGSISTTATISYTSTENVKAGSTTLTLSDGTTSKNVTITYSAEVADWTLQTINAATTWDFSKLTGSKEYSGDDLNIEHVYANIEEITAPASFDATALAFKGVFPLREGKGVAQNGTLHFKTSCPGNIIVKFSDTGTGASATAAKRYLIVNDVVTSYWASRENNNSDPNIAYAAQLNVTTGAIYVPAGDVTITGTGTSALVFSYLSFTPVDNVPTTTVTVGNTLYRTFASKYPLDFTEPVEGLKAYRAVISEDNVNIKEVNSPVPAGEGLLLKATEAKEYTIPVAADKPKDITNDFIGVIKETVVNGAGIFVLYKDDTHPLGFYKTTAESFTVGANTAYLPAAPTTARSFISIDNLATAIDAAMVENKGEKGEVYNLAGQRVAQPTKGLYIVNGKKVIIK